MTAPARWVTVAISANTPWLCRFPGWKTAERNPSRLKTDAGNAQSGKPRKKRKTQADTIAEYLNTLPEAALKDWLMEAASRDRGMRDKLLLNARAASGGKKNSSGLAALRSALLKAARQSVFLDWQQAEDFAERLHDAAQLVEDRIPLGEPGLPAIIEETIHQAEASLENVDDSNGAVQEALRRLGGAHLAACQAGRPDPIELAEHLFDLEIAAEWDFYPPTLPHYANVLGKEGLNRYRQLVLEAAKKLPVKTVKFGHFDAGSSHYAIERMMEALCEHDGDDDPMLRLLEKDLSGPHRYLLLAERHPQSGRHKEALECSERGLAAFPNEHNSGLIDFLIRPAPQARRSSNAQTNWLGSSSLRRLISRLISTSCSTHQRRRGPRSASGSSSTSKPSCKRKRPPPKNHQEPIHGDRPARALRSCKSTCARQMRSVSGIWPAATPLQTSSGPPSQKCAAKRTPTKPSPSTENSCPKPFGKGKTTRATTKLLNWSNPSGPCASSTKRPSNTGRNSPTFVPNTKPSATSSNGWTV